MNRLCCGVLLALMVSASGCAEEKTSTQSFAVGELGAAWQFPSDHLPIGGSVEGLNFALWNILDSRYLSFIEDNGQGLKESLIMQTNIPENENSSLTVRERLIVNHIFEMYHHPTHPRSVIALEEVSDQVVNELKRLKPEGMAILKTNMYGEETHDVFVFNAQHVEAGYSFGQQRYETKRGNTISSLIFRDKLSDIHYVFIQSHVPGGPVYSAPARKELAQFVMQKWDIYSDAVIVVMGDMNRSADYFLKDFAEAAEQSGYDKQPFVHYPISYPTHVDTNREASWIDNLFVYLPSEDLTVQVTENPQELFDNVQPAVDLLNLFEFTPK